MSSGMLGCYVCVCVVGDKEVNKEVVEDAEELMDVRSNVEDTLIVKT